MLLTAFLTIVAIVTAVLFMGSRPDPDAERMSARFTGLGSTEAGGQEGALDPLLKQVTRQSRGWIGALLRRFASLTGAEVLLAQANSTWTPRHLAFATGAVSLTTGLITLFTIPLPAVAMLVALASSYLPFAFLKLKRKRRVGALEKGLPDVIETMSRSLRAGHSLVAAISIVSENAPEPARSEFSEVFRKQNFGLPLRDAFMQMLDRLPSQDLRVLVTGILLQKETGGNLTQILDHTANIIRERLKLRGEVRVHTAQGRMTGWILCLLPIAMVVMINLINPGYSRVLTSDPFGRKLLYTGVILLLVGMFLIRRIVNGIEV